MKVFLQILTAGYELGVLPLAIGGAITFLQKKQINPFSYLLGYLVVFAGFLVLAVPLLCMESSSDGNGSAHLSFCCFKLE